LRAFRETVRRRFAARFSEGVGPMTNSTEVLIVGAGPTGLALALWLRKQGVAVRIIDKTAEPGTTSRAMAVHARTLELYRQLDLAEALIARSIPAEAVNLWVAGERRARMAFGDIGERLSPYPRVYIFPQDAHERLLIERLAMFGVEVERQTEFMGFEQNSDRVLFRLKGPRSDDSPGEAQFIVGCDGARSSVRREIGADFVGDTYPQIFFVADVEGGGPAFNGELNMDLDQSEFLGVFPMGAGHIRLVGSIHLDYAQRADELSFADVGRTAIDHLRLQIDKVSWFSTYHVHRRVADHFRSGRAFVAGDAAHIHSPAGGQGMNTGIGDAVNLAWKLAAALRGCGSDALLDSYQDERTAIAKEIVAATDRAFNLVAARGAFASLIRSRVFPALAPSLVRFGVIRRLMFRTVSQIGLTYRGAPFNEGVAGGVHGGDRLPWVRAGGGDNFDPLRAIAWQANVFGRASPELNDACMSRRLPLNATPWRPEHGEAGLAEDALYLTRPDSYVALADPTPSAGRLAAYFDRRGLRAEG
jgi:2-polyprenyl-6-methoxyphenol hydroxylase-like FAD-dependent oxidoreductase